MSIKSLSVTSILIVGLSFYPPARAQSKIESLTLRIDLQSAYNPGVKFCTPIALNDEVKLAWTRDVMRSSISALVSKSEGGIYSLKFELKEAVLDKIAYDVKAEPNLEPEVPFKLTFTKFNGFELGYDHTVRLSRESCK